MQFVQLVLWRGDLLCASTFTNWFVFQHCILEVSYVCMLKKDSLSVFLVLLCSILAWQCTSHSWGIVKMYF